MDYHNIYNYDKEEFSPSLLAAGVGAVLASGFFIYLLSLLLSSAPNDFLSFLCVLLFVPLIYSLATGGYVLILELILLVRRLTKR